MSPVKLDNVFPDNLKLPVSILVPSIYVTLEPLVKVIPLVDSTLKEAVVKLTVPSAWLT